MSTSGQGDQISEINKDDEPEIFSTKSNNDGLKETVGETNENLPVTAIDPVAKQFPITVTTVASDLTSSSYDAKSVTAVIASTSAAILETIDTLHQGSIMRVDTGCNVENIGVSTTNAVASEIPHEDVTKEAEIRSPKPGASKDIAKPIQAENYADSSAENEFELKWDDDDEDVDAIETKTGFELNVLNMELLEEALESKPEITSGLPTIKSVENNTSNENEEKDKAITANESIEESQKIIAEIDNLTQNYEINKTTKLVTEDDPITLLEDNKKANDVVTLEKECIEESKLQTTANEVLLKPLNRDEVMDVDNTEDITNKETLNATMSTNDSFEENQRIIAEIDSLTQNDEIKNTTKVPAESDKCVSLSESDAELKNVEILKNLNQEVEPLTEENEEMNVDNSEDTSTQEKETTEAKDILNAAVITNDSYENIQKKITELDSLTHQDEIDKTAELSTVTVDELDKQLEDVESEKPNIKEIVTTSFKPLTKDVKEMDTDNSEENKKETEIVKVAMTASISSEQLENVEILKNELDESEKPDIGESKPETKAIDVPPKISTQDDEVMNVDDNDSSHIRKDISTENQEISLDTIEKEKVESFQDETNRQSIDSKSNDKQEVDDTALCVQNSKKSSEEQNIAHQSSESQAIVEKVTRAQEVDDKTLEAQNILAHTDPPTEDNLEENASFFDDSLKDVTISPNKHHRINKPNVMLDIPTQDFSDIEAELSDSEMNDDNMKPEENAESIENSTKIDEKPSESNEIVKVTPEISRVTAPTIEIDATTSKLNITTVSPLRLKQASSTDVKIDDPTTKMQENLMKIDDENVADKLSTEVEKPSSPKQANDHQPSSSKDIGDDKLEKLACDEADNVQESDSLGLLAESSRVIDDELDDDEEEPEEPDLDENDDEDFDPYDESSNQMLEDLEDTDGSNSCTETKGDKIVENKVSDADEQTDKQPDKISNILEKVLGSSTDPKPSASSTKVLNFVELEGSSDSEDLKQAPKSRCATSVLNFVEVEGSSDSDDVEEVYKPQDKDLISVKVPAEVDVMLTSGAEGGTSAMHSNESEVVIRLPKPQSHKLAKINTSEVTIKSASKSLESIQIPETTPQISASEVINETAIKDLESIQSPQTTTVEEKRAEEEVFNIDSDEEQEKKIEELPKEDEKDSPPQPDSPAQPLKCINPHCSTTSGGHSRASRATLAYYSLTRRSGAACRVCAERAAQRSQALVEGIKDLRPLLELEMDAPAHQLVEISDSDEEEEPVDDSGKIGEDGAKFILDNLVDELNGAWIKYQMEDRLKLTETYLMNELQLIEAGAKELDAMLDECQKKTDAIRSDFYSHYEPVRKHVGGIVIHDTSFSSYSHTERDIESPIQAPSRYPKRRSASTLSDPPAKKPAVAVEPHDDDKQLPTDQNKSEEDIDISVVKLSAESAPASLPPHGELVRPPLCAGMSVYAMRNAFGTWNKAKILEIVQEATTPQSFTQCRVKFEHKVKNSCKVLAARCLAYSEPCEVRHTIGTRVIALFKDPHSARLDAFYAGVVAEVPTPVNNYRYLVFFDDGYAQYIQHADTRLVCRASALVWEEVHPFIHDFVKNYLQCYPERPMVRLRQGETLNTEWNGKWWHSRVLQVDASIALIHFDQDDRTEWIYRGSTRLEPLYLELQAAKAGGRSRLRLPRTKQIRSNMPCVEYTRSDELASARAAAEAQAQQRAADELRRQRAVAKKSTTDRPSSQQPTVIQGTPQEGVVSRVVYYTPKHAIKPPRIEPHACCPACYQRPGLMKLHDLRTYNPLAKPLLSGWERQIARHKGHREVLYRAPCGRRLRNMPELHKYLSLVQSDLSVDLFDFSPGTHCLAEFILNKCIVGKKDLSHGKENVPVPCVNYYDDSLPEFCSYNTERTPTAGVPLNLDPDFLCGCDCTDDCQDKSKCACWKMTLEGARTIGLEGDNVGYVYRRLPEPLPSGIYECNSRCKCKQTCLNRVAQHPLQLKLQVFKTNNRGWGIRALNDVPKGAFLCVYAGNLLTDATANLDGLNEGDEYLAELDYIEVVEGMKEGYEEDVRGEDAGKGKKDGANGSESESEPSSESEEEKGGLGRDDDFQPNEYIPQPQGAVYFQKSLRKREKAKKKEEEKQKEAAKRKEECITISDDEEVREPARFTADDIADRDRRHSSRVSVRTLFGKDEACYIMDAKVQGNIGRYLNHSCHPNVFVQNVFVDTHDPRFPWVAFFALTHVRAGHELTWNYNYDVGSVPGKVLYCYCEASNCRGRLL